MQADGFAYRLELEDCPTGAGWCRRVACEAERVVAAEPRSAAAAIAAAAERLGATVTKREDEAAGAAILKAQLAETLTQRTRWGAKPRQMNAFLKRCDAAMAAFGR